MEASSVDGSIAARRASKGVTRQIAEFVAAARYESLPAPVIEAAKDSFLDTLGIALAGAVEPAGRLMMRYALQCGGKPEASLLGGGARTPARAAAAVNGTLAHVIGYSDFSVANLLHPSVAVLPAVWALGEARGASGRTVLLAHVIGVEVSCKIGQALTHEFTRRGFHPCAAVGAFGAAAAAGKLLGLDAAQMASALGIAGQCAAGVKVSLGTMSKAYAVGHAAEAGVTSAELAALGFTGSPEIFEGRDGFFQTFGAGVSCDELRLGKPFEFEHPGITIKPYPACTRSHPAIDAAIELGARLGERADEIESVDCAVGPAVLDVVKVADPRNPMEAKFSLPFCVSTALIDRDVRMETFSEARLADARVRQMMQRVRPRPDPALSQRGPFAARVTVRLRGGEEAAASCDRNLWDQPGVATPEKARQLTRKFRNCAGRVLGERAMAEVEEIVRKLDQAPDLGRLMEIVRLERHGANQS